MSQQPPLSMNAPCRLSGVNGLLVLVEHVLDLDDLLSGVEVLRADHGAVVLQEGVKKEETVQKKATAKKKATTTEQTGRRAGR